MPCLEVLTGEVNLHKLARDSSHKANDDIFYCCNQDLRLGQDPYMYIISGKSLMMVL